MELAPEVEQQLADLNDDDWTALAKRVRPPKFSKPGEAGRAALARRHPSTNVKDA